MAICTRVDPKGFFLLYTGSLLNGFSFLVIFFIFFLGRAVDYKLA